MSALFPEERVHLAPTSAATERGAPDECTLPGRTGPSGASRHRRRFFPLTGYFTTAPVVAVPSRDVLAFCDRDSPEGIAALRDAIDRVWSGGDHLLSRSLYVRQDGVWVPFEG